MKNYHALDESLPCSRRECESKEKMKHLRHSVTVYRVINSPANNEGPNRVQTKWVLMFPFLQYLSRPMSWHLIYSTALLHLVMFIANLNNICILFRTWLIYIRWWFEQKYCVFFKQFLQDVRWNIINKTRINNFS